MIARALRSDTRSIALIGLRGSGKSTVGRALAELTGRSHIDTDELIVRRTGRSIAEIFAEEGESGFRRHEREVIAQVVANPPGIISVGGGAILDRQNVELLRGVAWIVWLTAPPEVLAARVCLDPRTAASRPPLTDHPGEDEIRRLLAERSACYERAADAIVDTADGSARDAVMRITERWEQLSPDGRKR